MNISGRISNYVLIKLYTGFYIILPLYSSIFPLKIGFLLYYLGKERFFQNSISPSLQHTVKIILAENPPFRHQTNTLYTPMTTLKYADPNGDLPIDIFYKMVFQHDKIFSASLNFIKLLRWRSRKSFDLGKPSQ